MTHRKPIIGGNWKMNTDLESGMQLAGQIVDGLQQSKQCDVVIFPPFPYLQAIETVIADSSIWLGGQDVWQQPTGAFTGEVSNSMLLDVGCTFVLAGHSERRHVIGETNELIHQKVVSALAAGLQVILCVGETQDERNAGETMNIVLSQVSSGLNGISTQDMDNVVIAYEPVWAIGTGDTATPEDAQTVHAAIRSQLDSQFDKNIAQSIRIQYGGSVNAENAASLFACNDIDGALVGGASLSAEPFTAIIGAASHS